VGLVTEQVREQRPTWRPGAGVPMKMEQSVPKRRHIKFRPRELPRRKHTTFRTWQKFEIKKVHNVLISAETNI